MTIRYTDGSWNFVLGCSAIAAGCKNCYAAREASTRLAHLPDYQGLAVGGKWTGKLVERGEKTWLAPVRRQKPQRLFVCSTSDLFHKGGDPTWIDRAWATMALAPQHTFIITTKRIERAFRHLTSPAFYSKVLAWADEIRAAMPKSHPCRDIAIPDPSIHPLRNVWLGVSASTQRELFLAGKQLAEAPAAVRWVSIEPQIEQVSPAAAGLIAHRGIWTPVKGKWSPHIGPNPRTVGDWECEVCGRVVPKTSPMCQPLGHPIDWILCGGESGPGARPFELEWAEDLAEETREGKIPYYFKQTGSNAAYHGKPFPTRHRRGEDPEEWPTHLRIRQFPTFANIAHAGDRKLVYRDE